MEEPESRPSAKEILEILDAEDGEDSILCVNIVEAPSALWNYYPGFFYKCTSTSVLFSNIWPQWSKW